MTARRMTILALGSRGDVQPYVALGHGLQAAGYRVRVVTFESFRSLVEAQGLDFHPVAADAQALVATMMGGGGFGTRNPLRLMQAVMRSFGAMADAYVEAFSPDALADSDAILNQLPGGIFGVDLAEKLGIPHLMLSVIPLTTTAAFANPLLTTRSFGPAGNRLSYGLAAGLLWAGFRPVIARFRRQLGLSSPPLTFPDPHSPVINGFSPHVVPPPADWPLDVYTTGYWLLDEPGWQPPADLLAFLDAGEPPVFIGFGSMIAPDPAALTRTLLDAVARCGCRAVISSGWAQIAADDLPGTIYGLDYAPYEWLFPRMSAVVHHGGSGTTGLALRGGVPSMVVAFGADQPYWGQRTAALGAGVAPLSMKTLTADALANSIQHLLADETIRARAAQIGAALREEHGIADAIRWIAHYVGQP
ncbi:MAG: glycosyltransferase family 1 protein [Anaerolineae bacterium]|nr:glycosyltransferase family 1 protein [Anaerolineae bacterium]